MTATPPRGFKWALPLSILLLAASCAQERPAPQSEGKDPVLVSGLTVIGHRGFSARAPEHTLLAYDLASGAGADYIEQDLQMTSDGVLVVLHDPTLDRTARGEAEFCTGAVIEKTLDQIRRCDIGSWFAEASGTAPGDLQTLRIPTLEEVFQRYGRDERYYIETKNPEEAPGMEEELIRLLDQYDLLESEGDLPRVIVQSFSPQSLEKLHALRPDLPLVQLFGRIPVAELRDSLSAVARYSYGIGPQFSSVDASVVSLAHDLGMVVHPYTVNDEAEMRRLQEIETDGFFTNEVERARQLE